MIRFVFKLIRYFGISFFFRKVFQKRKVTILLFHDIDKTNAQITFDILSKLYNIIDLSTYLEAVKTKNKEKLPSYSLIITFDDGVLNNINILPILKKYNIRPTIFLCAGLVDTNRHFWFKFLNSGKEIAALKRKSNDERLKILANSGFNQTKEYDYPQALSKLQINEMKSDVLFQSHTMFHPCLPNCKIEEANWEIFESKRVLETKFGLNVFALAYPNGDYSQREIELCKEAGYSCALTVDSGYNSLDSNLYKLKRLSVNDTTDMNELIVKASGVWGFIKKLLKGERTYSC